MKYKALQGLLLGILVFSNELSAAVVHVFTPSVVIEDNTYNAIEIYAPQSMFEVSYSLFDQSFSPLNIQFEVVSVKGNTVDYRLSPVMASAVCTFEDRDEQIKLEYKLNNQDWPESGLQFTGIRDSHLLNVKFPRVEQRVNSVPCDGQIGVQVELITL